MKSESPGQSGLFGRIEEFQMMQSRLEAIGEGKGNIVLIKGVAGVGKSRLTQALSDYALGKGFTVLRGSGQPYATFPYQLFQDALGSHLEEPLIITEAMTGFSEVFAVTNTGLLFAHASIHKETAVDSDILAGMLTAVQNFVKDSFGDGSDTSDSGLKRLEYQMKKILIEYQEGFYLAGVIEGEEHAAMQSTLAGTAHGLMSNYGKVLAHWDGRPGKIEGITPILNDLLKQRWRVLPSLSNINLESEKLKIFDHAYATVSKIAAQKPVLLIAEDMHWADEGSLGMFLYIARNARTERVMIVGTHRPEVSGTFQATLDKMTQEELHTTISLGGLANDDMKFFAEDHLRGPASAELIDSLCGRCEGNPLFARELLDSGKRDGTLVLKENLWQIQPGAELLAASLEELIARRLQSLSPSCFHALDLTACLGREFPIGNLEAVYGKGGSTRTAIEPLVSAGILLVDGKSVRFEHAMVQETAYSMAGRRRSAYHRQIAENLETAFAMDIDGHLYDIAYHYGRSEVAAKAFDFNEMAGDRAASENAAERAAAHYDVALASLISVPVRGMVEDRKLAVLERLGDVCTLGSMFDRGLDAFDRAASAQPEPEAKARIYRKRADLFERKGEYDSALAETLKGEALVAPDSLERWKLSYQKAWIFMRKGEFDEGVGLCEAAARELARFDGVERVLGEVYSTLGGCYYLKADYPKALELFIRSLEFREKAGDTQGIASSNNNIGVLLSNMGKPDESLERHEKCLAAMRKMGDQRGIATAYNNIGTVFLDKGDIEKALASHRESLKIREKIGDQQGIASSCCNLGQVFRTMGNISEALEYNRRGLKFFELTGDLWGVGGAHTVIGDCLRELGDYAKAIASYNEAIRVCKEIGSKDFHAGALLGLTEVYLEQGNTADAEPSCAEAEKIIEEGAIMDRLAHSLRLRGRIFSAQKEWSEAETKFSAALAESDKAGAETDSAKARFEWGKMLVASGDAVRGRDMLTAAKEVFDRRGMKRWSEKAGNALEGR